MLTMNELKDNRHYNALGTDGKYYHVVFVNDYIPGGVIFGCVPENVGFVGFEELENML